MPTLDGGKIVERRLRVSIDETLQWKVLEPDATHRLFVAICDQIGLSVQAIDRDGLVQAARDAIDTLTADLTETKDLLRFLVEHGFNHRVEVDAVQDTDHGFSMRFPSIVTETSSTIG